MNWYAKMYSDEGSLNPITVFLISFNPSYRLGKNNVAFKEEYLFDFFSDIYDWD
jgi:hypothetical protein